MNHVIYPIHKKCNLSCIGCTSYSEHIETSKMPYITNWREELTLLKETVNPDSVGLTGGEPLMHPDIREIVEFACSMFSIVSLPTNGLLIKEHTNFINEQSNLLIVVSLHGDTSANTKYASKMHDSLTATLSKHAGVPHDQTMKIINNFSSYVDGRLEENDLYFTLEHIPDYVDVVKVRNTNIMIRQNEWIRPELDSKGVSIPYDNDPAEAYKDCVCPARHYQNKKLYKCPVTMFLPDLLAVKGNIDDWPALRDFKPYDLENIGNDNIERLLQPEDVCRHCPVNSKKGQRIFGDKVDKQSKLFNIIAVDQ